MPAKKKLDDVELEKMRLMYGDPKIPLRDISAAFGVSVTTVCNHAKNKMWVRDAIEPIRQRAETILQAAVVQGKKLKKPSPEAPVEVRAAVALQEMDSHDEAALSRATSDAAEVITSEESVEINARALATIINHERQDIRRGRWVTNLLLEELLAQTGQPQNLEALIQVVGQNEEITHLAEVLRKMTSLPVRINSMAQIAGTMEKLIKLERVVHRIDDDDNDGKGTIEDFLVGMATR